MNVAILRLTDAVTQSRRGQLAEAEIKARAESLHKETVDRERVALLAEAEARKAVDLREAAVKGAEAARLRRDAEHTRREAEITIEEMRRLLLEDVLAAVQPQVKKLAEAHAVELVLLAPNPGLAYFSPKLDLTDELVRCLDLETPASSAQAIAGKERHTKKKG